MSRESERQLAQEIRERARQVADRVTEEFVRDHPNWMARFGPGGFENTLQDHRFHLQFLASALRYGQPGAFADYVRWCNRVLTPRRVSPAVLRNTLRRLEAALAENLGADRVAPLRPYFEVAEAASREPLHASSLPVANTVYLQALLAGDREAAVGICLEQLRRGTPLHALYRLIEDAQRELGRLWEEGVLSVAEEHLGTSITQLVLSRLAGSLGTPAPHRGRVVVTGVQGEAHHVGAQMVADALAMDGWDVENLGTNTPHGDVVRRVQDQRCSILAVSVMLVATLPELEELIRQVRRACGSDRPKIMVGGGAFHDRPDLWRLLGADGWAPDLEGAVRVARTLTPVEEEAPPLETLLLVDDEPGIRSVVKRILAPQNWRILEASSASEALTQARGLPLGAAILDLVMPGMSGLELAEQLRQDRPGLPLLFMSGLESPEGLPEGAVFVSKPFTLKSLRQGLQKALETVQAAS